MRLKLKQNDSLLNLVNHYGAVRLELFVPTICCILKIGEMR